MSVPTGVHASPCPSSRPPRLRAPLGGWRLALLLALVVLPFGVMAQGPPPPLPDRPIEFPGFTEYVLANGLRVVVVSYGSQPVMSARIYFRGGRSTEPAALSGLTDLVTTVLTRGTEGRSALDISEAIEGVGGSISAAAGAEFFSVAAVSLTDHRALAFELLEDVVRRANFPQAEVDLAQRQILSSLQAQLGSPQSIADRRFHAVMYGETHPDGISPTPETVRAIGREDLVSFRDRVFRPNGAMLLVAGLVDPEEIRALAETHFGDWSGDPLPRPEVPEPEEQGATRIVLVHRPGSVQSVVAVGHLGIRWENPDYFALQVLNRVLGGGADARLFQILREERGWTYGAYSQFTRPVRRGHFVAQAEVRTEVTDSTVVEILTQMRRLREESVPAEELEGAKSFLAGSFPLRLETADQIAAQLSTTLLLGLPIDEVTGYPERIRGITEADIRRVATTYLHPDRAAVIVVGDGVALLEKLEAIAPVELLDVEGNPLSREILRGDGG